MNRDAGASGSPGLGSPLTALKGVGPALAEKLARLGAESVEDLLFLLPLRYEDRTRVTRIGSARHGERVLVAGDILLSETVYRGRRSLLVRITDGSGQLTLRFFHFSRSQQARLARGSRIACYGEIRPGPSGKEMVHPEYRLLGAEEPVPVEDRLTPVYPTTEGVQQGRLRRLVAEALDMMRREAPTELVPRQVLERTDLPTLTEAVEYLHRPPRGVDLAELAGGGHPCQQRLAFEELLAHHLSLRRLRHRIRDELAPALADGDGLAQRFLDSLPFRLTAAQERVLAEISADIARAHPMLRLVQGDVGSGKTVVAAAACLKAIAAGCQAALMAPTELLAEQHYKSFSAWLEPLGIRPVWLTGSLRSAVRREALAAIADGSAAMVIGTHALFQEFVAFHNLALVVIDEQHRFGVHQRLALREKGEQGVTRPHQLVMTATPIPRTLAMTAYADLDTSVIDELPPGRRPVTTVVLPETRREEVIERVRRACAEGRQAYWVCPLVEESEQLDYQAAEASYRMLGEALPGIPVGLVHGRMKPAEKEAVMQAFKAGELRLLVATTVIEVGVDVPNASLMIVENAERMGLSQLHQLRGRVGRGSRESTCLLMYRPPLSEMARRRLAVLRETNDGFVVAEEDLRLRGPGEVLGTRQTGAMQLRIADLSRDAALMPKVQLAAAAVSPADAEAIIQRWLGGASRYGSV
ncbi:ATP-dependent DNA helicase RecG [Lentisalinibacter orientalis]|uniref:ATP-dependent DNA helicase RecG n=1 Tax=Lentisalinibacter orientalis TaxID=2992241 RepID=UPI0038676ED6